MLEVNIKGVMCLRLTLVLIACLILLCGDACGKQKVVDLSHPFNARTHQWPANIAFNLTVVSNTTIPIGWYATNNLCLSEHTGTHLDAPAHFASREGIWYASTIPVERLVAPLSLISLQQQAENNRDYLVTENDIASWEEKHGMIPEGAVVIFEFGWSKYWDSYEDVFGSNSTDTTTFHFPGVGIDAAKVLAKRNVYGVGVDTPSVDYGPSQEAPAHYLLLEKNIYCLENVGDMTQLPTGGKGVTLVVGVMKIDGGSGGPARLIAMFDEVKDSSAAGLTLSSLSVLLSFIIRWQL